MKNQITPAKVDAFTALFQQAYAERWAINAAEVHLDRSLAIRWLKQRRTVAGIMRTELSNHYHQY